MPTVSYTAAAAKPGMPLWLGRIGEVPRGMEPLENFPWEIIEPHEQQARKNHGQSLKRLKERGGLSVSEAVAILEDRAWFQMPIALAVTRLAQIVEAYNAERGGG